MTKIQLLIIALLTAPTFTNTFNTELVPLDQITKQFRNIQEARRFFTERPPYDEEQRKALKIIHNLGVVSFFGRVYPRYTEIVKEINQLAIEKQAYDTLNKIFLELRDHIYRLRIFEQMSRHPNPSFVEMAIIHHTSKIVFLIEVVKAMKNAARNESPLEEVRLIPGNPNTLSSFDVCKGLLDPNNRLLTTARNTINTELNSIRTRKNRYLKS